MKNDRDDSRVTESSGNVFADIGVPEPDLMHTKALFAMRIADVIRANGWTQVQAAKVMRTDQPTVSEIVRGKIGDYTVDRLLVYLIQLGVGVTFQVQQIERGKHKTKTKPKAKPIRAAASK